MFVFYNSFLTMPQFDNEFGCKHSKVDQTSASVYESRGFLGQTLTLKESLSITTGHCDLAIATHARKMH